MLIALRILARFWRRAILWKSLILIHAAGPFDPAALHSLL
jgi:hypothetical protein